MTPGTRVRFNSIEYPNLGWIDGTVRHQDVTGRVLVRFDCGHAEWIVPQCLEAIDQCRGCGGRDGWYTSYNGGFAHPMPCEYCNPGGLPTRQRQKHRTGSIGRGEHGEAKSRCAHKVRPPQSSC